MKTLYLYLFVLVSSMYAITVNSQNVKVTIDCEDSSIRSIISEIESQTEFLFIVDSDVDTRKEVTVRVKDKPLSEVLEDLSKQMNIQYKVSQKHIILSKNVVSPIHSTSSKIDSSCVIGTIKDELGDPLIGVNVLVKNTSQGTVTDISGNFEISAKVGDVLVISYIGSLVSTKN